MKCTYENFSPAQAHDADSMLAANLPRLRHLLEDSLYFRATIYLAKTADEFTAHIGGFFPDWGAAAAIPARGLIVIKSPDYFPLRRSMNELLIHEYSHLALAHIASPGIPPRWLDEGLATMLASPWTWEENLLMSRTAVFGRFPQLDDIDRVNLTDEQLAELWYATARLAFEFFLDRYGPEGLAGLCWRLRQGLGREEAFRQTTGMGMAEFERAFVAHLRERYDFFTLILDMQYFWLILVILLVVGGVMRLLAKRGYEKRWREQEKFESTDFDYGDPRRPEQIDDDEPWRGERD